MGFMNVCYNKKNKESISKTIKEMRFLHIYAAGKEG